MTAAQAAFARAASPLHDRPRVRRIERADPYLLLATLLLIGYGLVMTYSTTLEDRSFTGDVTQAMLRAAAYAAIGLAATEGTAEAMAESAANLASGTNGTVSTLSFGL